MAFFNAEAAEIRRAHGESNTRRDFLQMQYMAQTGSEGVSPTEVDNSKRLLAGLKVNRICAGSLCGHARSLRPPLSSASIRADESLRFFPRIENGDAYRWNLSGIPGHEGKVVLQGGGGQETVDDR